MAKKPTTAKSGAKKTARKRKAASTATAAQPSAKKTRKKTGKKTNVKTTANATKKIAAAKASGTRKTSSKKPTTPKAPSATKKGTKATAKGSKASKKRVKAKKVPAALANSQDPILPPEPPRRIPKTYLSAKELREFKELLLQKRAELYGDVERLSSDSRNSRAKGNTEHSSMPIHMADLGTDNWEKEFTLGLIVNEQSRVREIDEALNRIGNRTYGICLATHNEISRARLRAKPWAKYCIEHAKAREEGRLP